MFATLAPIVCPGYAGFVAARLHQRGFPAQVEGPFVRFGAVTSELQSQFDREVRAAVALHADRD